jgi:putative spermidine/putrescine transport system permease protein
MSIPAMVSAGVLVFIMAMGFYITPVLLGGPADTMISQLIVTQVTTMLNLNFGYALSVILLVATLAVIILSNLFVPIEQMWAVQESSGSVAGSRKLPAPLVRALKHFLRLIELFLDALLKRPQWLVSALMAVYVWIVVLFLLLPLIITYILSFSSSPFLVFPPPGFSLQWYEKFFNDPQWRSALWMSVKIASAAATLSVVIGTCAAMGLVRGTFKAKRALFLFLLAPLLVPVIVVALSMYVSMSKIGLLGTFAGLCIGHLVLTVPYAIVIIVAAVKGLDRNLEYAASTLGATNFQTQRRIVLPLLAPALATAWIMSFLSSFDELLVTLFLLGRQEQTLPLKMWSDIRIQIDPVISSASATIVTVVALIVILSQFKSLRSKAAAHDSEGK